jgi:hypothetical protein
MGGRVKEQMFPTCFLMQSHYKKKGTKGERKCLFFKIIHPKKELYRQTKFPFPHRMATLTGIFF